AQVAQHHLDLQTAAAEDDGLDARANPWGRDPPRLEHRAAPDAEVAAEERRIVEDEATLAARGAVLIDKRDVVLFEQPASQLERIADRRRRADELRVRAVKGADPLQAPDHVGDLAPEKAAVRVQLVDDDEFQARE